MCVVLEAGVAGARIKIKTDYDKTFDFSRARSYTWHPDGAGEVKVLQLSGDNPVELRAKFEPVIVPAVEEALARRGLTKAAMPPADLHVSYYVLIGPNVAAQTMGQFVRPVPEWGLPPFAPATQSLEIYEQGTLILDVADAAADRMIWRGSARAEIDRQNSAAVRAERIRTAVRDMLKKFPAKR